LYTGAARYDVTGDHGVGILIDRDLLTGFLRIGFFLGGCGLVMMFLQPPSSAEFILSGCSAVMGCTLVVGVVLLTRMSRRKD